MKANDVINLNGVQVYVAKIPFEVDFDSIYPEERKAQIKQTASPKLKAERFYSWKLLELALKDSGINISKLKFAFDDGKWAADKICFSISHSHGVVGVAISEHLVGLDIEKMQLKRFDDRMANKLLTDLERDFYEKTSEKALFLNELWTKKEATFKALGKGMLRPQRIECDSEKLKTELLAIGDDKYFVSVYTKEPNSIKFNIIN